MARKSIELHKGNALAYLGQIYRNHREAAKEYITNALDGWYSANGVAGPHCVVNLNFKPDAIRIESSGYPGMDQDDFERAMQSVAQSLKVGSSVRQVGERGIGLFAFQQFANKATIWSKKEPHGPTWRFELRKGEADYDWQQAIHRERLTKPGVAVELTGLSRNPLASGSALNPKLLRDYLSEVYALDLREARLQIGMHWKDQSIQVQAPPITLEPVAIWLSESGGFAPTLGPITGELYFDPAGAGQVSIRHKGLPIIRNMRDIEPPWEGFETSVLCTGYVDGAFDADFLTPLATRSHFEDNEAWRAFVDWIRNNVSLIAEDIQDKLDTLELQRLVHVDEEARRLAGRALRSPMLRSLQLLDGRRPTRGTESKGKQRQKGSEERKGRTTRRNVPPGGNRGTGMAIRLIERPFPPAKRSLHSEYDGEGRIIVNTQHSHYKRFVGKGQPKTQIWYEALLIGKETVGYNYDGTTDALERLVAFTCEVDAGVK